MTQPEINNLVKLLMSGDEQNILMAKAICEERKIAGPVKIITNKIEKIIISQSHRRYHTKKAIEKFGEFVEFGKVFFNCKWHCVSDFLEMFDNWGNSFALSK